MTVHLGALGFFSGSKGDRLWNERDVYLVVAIATRCVVASEAERPPTNSSGATIPSPPRVVVTGAETLLAHQRRDIQQATGATLTDQYGLAEGCGNASQCTAGAYHEDFEFGILECIDGAPAEGGVRGRIVCTGLADLNFPFLRYDAGDLALFRNPDTTCSCGRHSAMLGAIEGRADDAILTPEGLHISAFDYIFDDTPRVKECQIVQDRPGAITVRVVGDRPMRRTTRTSSARRSRAGSAPRSRPASSTPRRSSVSRAASSAG